LEQAAKLVNGYICTPHEDDYGSLIDYWKKSQDIADIYFVTATFSDESIPYFPNKANHYILASFLSYETVINGIAQDDDSKSTFVFNINNALFERSFRKLNYVSMYFMKYSYRDTEISDIANVIAKRERVTKASLASILLINSKQLKFTFPYSKNILVLEVEGEKTHQSDQKYCERTRRDVGRKGIPLCNLFSLSILEKLK